MTLRLSKDLALPLDVAGETTAILAKRGAGKTNTATVLVEELVGAGVQTVIIDPVGAWWGIRSSADGEHNAGLAIPIIGGQHGDVPLEQTAGALIADVAVDSGQSMLLDLSDFPSKASVARFVTDFAERLYRRKARQSSLLHLVLEEADEFAPQASRADTARMRGAIEQIVRRGRSRGLGVTLITQRSAVLNKDVLTQADVLVVMRTTGPHDVAAIKQWVSARGDEHGATVIESLPGLATGEAWFWNPERDLLQRTLVRRRRTFDSSATPKAGQRRVEPKDSAAIDLTALGERIQATAEKAKADDPRELRKKIAALERQVREPTTEVVRELVEVQVPVEVPALDEDTIELLQSIVGELRDVADTANALRAVADQIDAGLRAVTRPRAEQVERREVARAGEARPNVAPARRPAPPTAEGDIALKPGARRMLEILATFHPMQLTRTEVGVLGRVTKGGTFSSYLSALRVNGLIGEDGDSLSISDAGLDVIGEPPPPPDTQELKAMYEHGLKPGVRRMLDVLYEAHPEQLTRDELALRADVTKGGTFSSYLSKLRTTGLISERGGQIGLSEALFLGARA